ncbi:MAG: protein translocase subunit SecF [Clostridiales bacterium]|jgi:preprotein translocase subunit SecF|nr:protein translocase subunit SecF [Clostridiales bacterium]
MLKKTNFDFIGKRKIWYIIALVFIIPGVVSMIFQGFNQGLEFTGGNIMHVQFAEAVDQGQLREIVSSYVSHSPNIQSMENNQFYIRTVEMQEEESRNMTAEIEEKLGSMQILRSELIGPVVGKELVRNAQISVVIALIGILLYVTLRFRFNFALAAVLTLVHDVLVTMGIFSLLRLEIDGSFIAAILTIVGYSVNNVVVIFDRVRENSRASGRQEFQSLVNTSINQTLSRSINTVLAVVVLLLSLIILGGETTRILTFGILIGVIAGLFSSVTMAGSFVVDIDKFGGNPKTAKAR